VRRVLGLELGEALGSVLGDELGSTLGGAARDEAGTIGSYRSSTGHTSDRRQELDCLLEGGTGVALRPSTGRSTLGAARRSAGGTVLGHDWGWAQHWATLGPSLGD
jgi:hypothetical protein